MVTKNKIQKETVVKITKWVLDELIKFKKSDKILDTKYKSKKDMIDNVILDYLHKKKAIKENDKK